MKGRGKRKFFKCLEPSGVHGGGRRSKRSSPTRREMACDGRKSKPSVDGDAAFDDASPNGDFPNDNDRPAEKPRRSFSRAIRAALFETSLSRKFRRKGSCMTIVESKDTDSSQTEKTRNFPSLDDSKQCWGAEENLPGSRSRDMWGSSVSLTTTTTLSSSRASSMSASERKMSEAIEDMAATRGAAKATLPTPKPPRPAAAAAAKEPIVPGRVLAARNGNLRIICFVILSLMALVFWGKALAVVCTSMWLYWIPRFSSSPEVDEGFPDELQKSKFSNRLA